MSNHDTALAEESLRILKSRARAEELRREACRLADRYQRLAIKHTLDPEIVRDNIAAVLSAWGRLQRQS